MNTNNIIAILGQTGSGKSTLSKLLAKRLGYKRILEYTTRPMRDGEVNHMEYHFISNEEFLKFIEQDAFVSYKYFDTIYGRWYYGSIEKDYAENGVIVINPGALKLLNERGIKSTSIYIKLDDEVILGRLSGRGDDVHEVQRRLDTDRPLFDELPEYVNIIVDGTHTPEQLVEEIISLIKEENNDA